MLVCASSSGILTDHPTESILSDPNSKHKIDKKAILLLNQRKLPKQLVNCKADVNKALNILGNAYHHLSFSLEEDEDEEEELSYEQLIDILDRGCSSRSAHRVIDVDRTKSTLDDNNDTRIMDGKSIVAALEVLRKAYNIPAALRLLRLSVETMQYNHKVRTYRAQQQQVEEVEEDAAHDKNEARRVYKAIFSLLGHASQSSKTGVANYSPLLIKHLLHHHMPVVATISPTKETYHAAINALGRFGECDLILSILGEMEASYKMSIRAQNNECVTQNTAVPVVDRMAYQSAIASLARHGHCREATGLLERMQSKGFQEPDMNIYNELLIGIAKEVGRKCSHNNESDDNSTKPLHKVALDILHEMEMKNKKPTDQTYNSIISSCGKVGAWDDAARVASKMRSSSANAIVNSGIALDQEAQAGNILDGDIIPQSNGMHTNTNAAYFHHLQCYRQGGKGKDSWWEIGRYILSDDQIIIIGIQPHRNPVMNGLSLVFYDKATLVKLGRMLLKNNSSPSQPEKGKIQTPRHWSSLIGMEVNTSRRGEGLSKKFVAIWLRICLETNAYPRAAVMNKPLISYVLSQFNFMPHSGGSRVELIRLNKEDESSTKGNEAVVFGLYSSTAKSLHSLFSQRVLRTQNIGILDHLPPYATPERRAAIYLKTQFEHPIAVAECAVMDYKPPSDLIEEVENLDGKMQRELLDRQINTLLRTNGDKAEECIGCAQLDFLNNSTSLKNAFLTYV